MAILWISALGEALGKTALCAGLAKKFEALGKRVGYLKPIAVVETPPGPDFQDEDTIFLQKALSLEMPPHQPLALTRGELEAVPGWEGIAGQVQRAYERLAQDKDVILMEGLSFPNIDSPSGKAALQLTEALGAKVILIARYAPAPPVEVGAAALSLEGHLLGVILNFAPPQALEACRASWSQTLGRVKLLGVLPEDRCLLSLSVDDLPQSLGGDFLDSQGSSELIENVMLGVMTADPVLPYFQRRDNKAVVVRSNRPDLQLAALETAPLCLVLSGDTPPLRHVTYRARELGIPLLQAPQDTEAVLQRLGTALAETRFRHQKKLAIMEPLLASLDWAPILEALA